MEPSKNLPCVVALTIIDAQTLSPDGSIGPDSRMLYGVRRPETNLTHPNVLSTPTMRIPECFALALTGLENSSQPLRRSTGTDDDEADELLSVVWGLLFRKLGIRRMKDVRFEARYAHSIEGVAEYPELSAEEALCMINLRVDILSGADSFPSETASYKPIGWTRAADFLDMWEGKDVTKVGISAKDALTRVCVSGLCVLSSYEYLARELKGLP